jgi:Flp pilus assembly pilin Flp
MSDRKAGLARDERGQSLVEYGTITGMIGSVVAAIGTFFKAIGDLIGHLFHH